MLRALRLARRALGATSPNPAVGAVVVRDGRVVGEGYHRRAGLPHAEVEALRAAGELARGADLYVTLEPCCHQGRTPPCTQAILEAGVRRVIVGTLDPNPRVHGRGVQLLREAGLEVEVGVLEEACRELNRWYEKYITTGMPYVTLKLAASLDGKIATHRGDSRWITSERARAEVHRLRGRSDAVVVGANTVLRDDPQLTPRAARPRRVPLRVVVDARLRVDPGAAVLRTPPPTLVATTEHAPSRRREEIARTGAEVVVLPARGGMVDLKALMRELGRREVATVLMEGGGQLAASALEQGLVDRVMFFYAPLIIGGELAPSMVRGAGAERLEEAVRLQDLRVRRLGPDLLVEARCSRG